jgi:uncharacterized protein YbjT (DUF2867 family)
MSTDNRKLIAVIGATGRQGGSVVRALQANGEFRVRALTRNPGMHTGLADEVIEADMTRPETLAGALDGAYGVFVVTNFWEPGTNEIAQARAVIDAAKTAGVQHFVWSTLPDVEVISDGKYHVPHFTDKAKVDALVKAAGFPHYTFVVAPFFYQNLLGNLAPQKQQDGSTGWTLPIDPDARVIHMGDITELGDVVVGALAQPAVAGTGQYLPLVGDLLSFSDVVSTLNELGHGYTFSRVPPSVFATFFPGAGELAEMFGYFERHTYLGATSDDQIALARAVAGRVPTEFARWARANMLVMAA